MTIIWFIGKQYVIYGSKHEAEADGQRVSKVIDAVVGDYVPTTEGYYVPVTKVNDRWKGSLGDGKVRDVIEFPGGKHVRFNRLTQDSSKVTWDSHDWINSEKKLPGWKMQVAEYVARGVQIEKAIENVLCEPSVPIFTLARRLMLDRLFIDHVFNRAEGTMALRDMLSERAIDHGYLADKIKDLVEKEKTPTNLRLWALQTIKEALDGNQKSVVQLTQNVQNNNYLPAPNPGSVIHQLKEKSREAVLIEEKKDLTQESE